LSRASEIPEQQAQLLLKVRLWCGWSVVEGRVGPDRVVVLSPLLDDDLRFLQAVEDSTVQQFIA
jgi:hypothetical protein